MISNAITVGSTATLVVTSDNINRSVYVHNAGGQKVYLGGSSVTTSTGFHLANAESMEIFIPANQTLYGIVSSGTNDLIVLKPDAD